MADDNLMAELERLRAENERLKNRQTKGVQSQGEREGWCVGLRPRSFSGDALQGAMDSAARHGR